MSLHTHFLDHNYVTSKLKDYMDNTYNKVKYRIMTNNCPHGVPNVQVCKT